MGYDIHFSQTGNHASPPPKLFFLLEFQVSLGAMRAIVADGETCPRKVRTPHLQVMPLHGDPPTGDGGCGQSRQQDSRYLLVLGIPFKEATVSTSIPCALPSSCSPLSACSLTPGSRSFFAIHMSRSCRVKLQAFGIPLPPNFGLAKGSCPELAPRALRCCGQALARLESGRSAGRAGQAAAKHVFGFARLWFSLCGGGGAFVLLNMFGSCS